MAQTPIILLALDYLLKGEGLAPSKDVKQALEACGPLRTYGPAPVDEEGNSEPDPNAALNDLPIEMVLSNVEARIERLLGTGEQGIRRFVSIFNASGAATSMTNGVLDAAASLKSFKSFNDFGPNINNIQDLVTGGKTGTFPGGTDAMSKLGDGLKGMGSMYNPESLASIGSASSMISNLNSQGALPASVTDRLADAGIDLDNMSDEDDETLKKILSEVDGAELEKIGTVTKFPTDKLENLSDALDASKVLPAGALSALPAGNMASVGGGLETIAGTGDFADIGKKLSGTKVPELRHLMAAPPDFSKVSGSLKDKFTSLKAPSVPSLDTNLSLDKQAASLGLPTGADPVDIQAKAASVNSWLSNSRSLMPAGFDINKVSVPSLPGHIPKVPSLPGVPSIPLEIPGFAPGGVIDTAMYINTPDEDLTYTGDDAIVWDRVNTERLNRGLPDLAALGTPKPKEPEPPPTATPNGTPGVYQMMGTISSQGPIYQHLKTLAEISNRLPAAVDTNAVSVALAHIQVALDQEQGVLTAAGVDLAYDGPTGYMGVTAFAEKLHSIGVDKNNLGLGRFIEELAVSADSAAGDSVIAALYEGRNLAA